MTRPAFAALGLVTLVLAPSALATISVWQNDGGTGGDAGNWVDHAAPLRNRHGGSAGAYLAEMYHYADEVDWYSFGVPTDQRSADVAFTVQSDASVPCESVTEDTSFVAQLLRPDNTSAGAPVVLSPCYGTGTLHVDAPAAGTWRLGFTLEHPSGIPEDGPTGHTTIGAPTSSYVHPRYAFSIARDSVC